MKRYLGGVVEPCPFCGAECNLVNHPAPETKHNALVSLECVNPKCAYKSGRDEDDLVALSAHNYIARRIRAYEEANLAERLQKSLDAAKELLFEVRQRNASEGGVTLEEGPIPKLREIYAERWAACKLGMGDILDAFNATSLTIGDVLPRCPREVADKLKELQEQLLKTLSNHFNEARKSNG